MEYGLFGLVVLMADLYAIYQVLTSGTSTAGKIVWALAILLLPVLGFIAWLVFGPRGNSAAA